MMQSTVGREMNREPRTNSVPVTGCAGTVFMMMAQPRTELWDLFWKSRRHDGNTELQPVQGMSCNRKFVNEKMYYYKLSIL